MPNPRLWTVENEGNWSGVQARVARISGRKLSAGIGCRELILNSLQ